MLRRFETYGFADHATPELQAELARVLRETGTYIPEVLDSAVGRNRSDAGVDLVWEHAYDHPDAYAHYMRHPFHICVLDRYLLPENPECITASRRELQLGLFGYEVEGAPFRWSDGVRRVVPWRAAPDARAASVDAFVASLNARADAVAEVRVSVAAANTMGLEWFPDGWTHVWEQVFDDESAMAATLDDEAAVLAAGPVSEWIDVWYEIDAVAPGAVATPDAATVPGPGGPIFLVETVVVAPQDTTRYLDAFEHLYLPGARRRGMDLVSCTHTPVGIGEDVGVMVVFAIAGWAEWEQARNTAVVDPAMPEWLSTRHGLVKRGTRRFHEAAMAPDAGTRRGTVGP